METVINKEELTKLENEVNAKIAEEAKSSNEAVAKKIREEVTKEFEQKQVLEKLQSEQASMKAELEKSKAEQTRLKEEADKKLVEQQAQFRKEMEEMLAQKRGIVATSQSPFSQAQVPVSPTSRQLSDGRVIDIAKLSPEEMKAIEEESMVQFYKYYGLSPPRE
jgi:hypothetical protein